MSPNQTPLSALEPVSKKVLADLLKDFHSNKTNWHPCGLETRVDWGAPIQSPSQPVSLKEHKRIIEHAKDDLTISVEAGLPLAELQAALSEHNQWLPIDWPWGSRSLDDPNSAGTIGGLVARGLSGGLRHRYLGVRDQIIGIGMLRSDGVSGHSGGKVVKNVAGYDLMRLLCGSWGSLGLITELTLRTQPIRNVYASLFIKGSLKNLEEFRAEVIHASFSNEYFDWVGSNQAWELQIGLASITHAAIKDQIQRLNTMAKAHDLNIENNTWEGPLIDGKFPENISKKTPWLLRISLPAANVHKLLFSKELEQLISWNWRMAAGIGVGDGWQSNFETSTPINSHQDIINLRRFIREINGRLMVLKQPDQTLNNLPAWLDAPSRPLIETVKKTFDPKNQLSKGRIPGVAN